MPKIVAVVNQKGGVGKTTTAVNLAASLAFRNQEILLIDLDPQGNASSGMGVDKRQLNGSMYDVLLGTKNLAEVVLPTPVQHLDLAPSHIDLIGAEVELVSAEGRQNRLKTAIEQAPKTYSYVFLDCPPSLGLLTVNALCAAQTVLIPIQCEYYAMEGLSQLVDTVRRVQAALNPSLQIEGVVFTMYDSRMKLANDVIGEVKKVFEEKVFQTSIPRNVRLAEAPSFGKPALLYDFSSKGSQAYLNLAYEFLKRNGAIVEEDLTQEVSA